MYVWHYNILKALIKRSVIAMFENYATEYTSFG